MEKINDLKKWIILIFTVIIGHWIINNLAAVGNIISKIFNIAFPFILGGSLAFILNIPMTFFEKKIWGLRKKKVIKPSKFIRILSIIFAIIVIVFVLTLIAKLVIPELVDVINLLINNMPYYITEIFNFIENYDDNLLNIKVEEIDIQGIKNELINQIPLILTSSISVVGSVFGAITTTIISIVFAIYILLDKESLKEQTIRLLNAYFNKEKVKTIIRLGNISNSTFKNFFTVQCLEATILGGLCIIGMLILQLPYAVPIGVLVGVTALIPVVGAFIGIIIGALLIISTASSKVLTFIIFVLVLQQIEGNLIYPRVVGNSVGLPGMWVLVAVSIGGSIGGMLGMLLGVPVFSIIYSLLKNDIKIRLEEKK